MIAALAPYAEYKATEKEWFGVVPKHWDVLPNRSLFSEVKDRNHPDEEMLSVTIKRGVVRQKTLLADSSKKDSSNLNKSAYKLVQPADIAYNKMRTWQGAIGVSEFRGIISPAYIVMRLRNKENTPRYFHHLYRTPQFAKEAERWSYGITSDMWSLRPEHFKVIYTPQPSREEQDAIVRFLNWANVRLERAIRAKQKVIALLNEQKQAIIHRAVTHGLDPSLPLKPSGIPWLGDIPQHWQVMPIKRACVLVRDGTHLPPARTVAGFPLLSVRNIINGRLVRRPDDSFISKADFEKLNSSFVVQPKDILMAIVGATLGKVAVVEDIGPFQIQRSLAIIRPRSEILLYDFLAMFLRSPRLQQYLWQSVAFSAQPGIYLGFVSNIPIPVPPTVVEQASIYEILKQDHTPINSMIASLEGEVDLLREYRTRLVADVVTGKLDVREVAAKLPDEEMPAEVDVSSEDEISDEEIAV